MCLGWSFLKCSAAELNLNYVLSGGQSFRWKQAASGEWLGVINKAVWILKQDEHGVQYKVLSPSIPLKENESDKLPARKAPKAQTTRSKKTPMAASRSLPSVLETSNDDNNTLQTLRDYLQLTVNVSGLYDEWCKTDENFTKVRTSFQGIRLLRQDPVENLFSFICSQNNHISRITSLVDKLCEEYGEFISSYDGKRYYSFPTIEQLGQTGSEDRLRQLGFGYRAKFIHHSAVYIANHGGSPWLYSLRDIPYEEARDALCCLPGVGMKVADCVCLMSLDKTDAIPIDTHMWQIACRDYLPHLKKYKSLTDKVYHEIGNHFRKMFGTYSGWAHSVLFSADLKKFQKAKVPVATTEATPKKAIEKPLKRAAAKKKSTIQQKKKKS